MSPTRALMATPLHHAVEGHFAPFVRLTLSTLALAVGAMFVVATTRTASAFAEPQSYLGRFINREFYADYSPAAEHPMHIIAVTLDTEGGAEAARTLEITSFTELRPEILDSANADAAALDRVPRERPATVIGADRADGARMTHGSSGETSDTDVSDSGAPSRAARRAAMQTDLDLDPSGDPEASEPTSDTRPSTTGRPTATPIVNVPEPAAPRPSGRPTRVPLVEAEVPAPTRVPVPSAEPVSTHQPQPTVQPTPDRRNIEVPATPGSDIALPTVKPTTPVGPPETGGTGGGIQTATPPSPTPSSSGDPGTLGTVPTVIPTLVPPIVPTAVPPVLTVVPFVQPTVAPTQPTGSGSGGGLLNPIPTLVPTVPPVLPTVGSLLKRL